MHILTKESLPYCTYMLLLFIFFSRPFGKSVSSVALRSSIKNDWYNNLVSTWNHRKVKSIWQIAYINENGRDTIASVERLESVDVFLLKDNSNLTTYIDEYGSDAIAHSNTIRFLLASLNYRFFQSVAHHWEYNSTQTLTEHTSINKSFIHISVENFCRPLPLPSFDKQNLPLRSISD